MFSFSSKPSGVSSASVPAPAPAPAPVPPPSSPVAFSFSNNVRSFGASKSNSSAGGGGKKEKSSGSTTGFESKSPFQTTGFSEKKTSALGTSVLFRVKEEAVEGQVDVKASSATAMVQVKGDGPCFFSSHGRDLFALRCSARGHPAQLYWGRVDRDWGRKQDGELNLNEQTPELSGNVIALKCTPSLETLSSSESRSIGSVIRLESNAAGDTLCIVGSSGVAAIRLPPFAGSEIDALGAAKVATVDSDRYGAEVSVVSAKWHPLCSQHLVVLGSDGALCLYDLRETFQSGDGAALLSPALKLPFRVDEPIDFCFGATGADPAAPWLPFAVYVFSSDGEIKAACPFYCGSHKSVEVDLCWEDVKRLDDPSLAAVERWMVSLNPENSHQKARYVPAVQRVCWPAEPPAERLGRNRVSTTVTNVASLRAQGTPLVCLLRAWSSGHVESLLCASPMLPRVVERPMPATSPRSVRGSRRHFTPRSNHYSPAASIGTGRLTIRTPDAFHHTIDGAEADLDDGGMSPLVRSIHEGLARVSDRKRDPPFSGVSPVIRRQDSDEQTFGGEEGALVEADEGGDAYSDGDEEGAPDSDGAKILYTLELFDGRDDCSIELRKDDVFADMCACVDASSGRTHMLWLPWLNQIMSLELGDEPDMAALFKTEARELSGVNARGGSLRTVGFLTEPLVGHFIVEAGQDAVVSDGIKCSLTDLGRHCSMLRARAETHGTSQAVGEFAALSDTTSAATSEELDGLFKLAEQLRNGLGEFSSATMNLPSSVRSLHPRDANPLDAGDWMNGVFRGLTYGAGGSDDGTKPLPVMLALRQGHEAVEEYRRVQMVRLQQQHNELRQLRADLVELRKNEAALQKRTRGMVSLFAQLSDDAKSALHRVRSIQPSSTASEREAAAKLRRLGRKTATLEKSVKATEKKAAALEEDRRELRQMLSGSDSSRENRVDGYALLFETDADRGKIVADLLVGIQTMVESMGLGGRMDVDEMRKRARRLAERLAVASEKKTVV